MIHHVWRSLGLVLACLVHAAGEVADLRLVPFPKEIQVAPGAFPLRAKLVLEAPVVHADVIAGGLNDELQRAGFPPVSVRKLGSPELKFRLGPEALASAVSGLVPPENPEGYILGVRSGEVICAAAQPAGLFYGLQTLRQLIRANRRGDELPALAIRDFPSLRWRCFQDDMTRGPSSKLETLQFEAALGASLKLNLMTFYMEYQYGFRKHPDIGPPDGSLLPEELAALVAFAKPLYLDILGNQQSFGHFGRILSLPAYASLRETADVLTPERDETYRLLDDLYGEVCPLLPFPWFNVCCDETYGLGTGPSQALAREIGVGGVYVRHIRRVHDLLREKHGKRMMMWGDIILQHPDRLDQVPKDTIMLTWGYDARDSFEDQILPFARSGYEFFICPGVNNWSRILPDFGVAVTNIRNFVRDGAKHGALGMLNTDWEDDGEALNAVKWHADAWAAECAWNASAISFENFNRRVGAVLFGESGTHFGDAVALLAQTHRQPAMKGMFNARFWEADFVPKASPAATTAVASNLLAVVRPALEHLDQVRREARCNPQVLDALRFGARRMELMGTRMLDGLEAVRLYEAACEGRGVPDALPRIVQLLRKNRDAHQALGQEFAALWLAESKPYALDWTLRRYTNTVAQYDGLLARVTAAAEQLRAGVPLPSPDEMGLAFPRPLTRQVQPERVATPLAPGVPWAEIQATHRFGLEVDPGAVDRCALPVEVDLRLPPELRRRPVRAFRIAGEQSREELPAQLDPLETGGKSRLILLFPEVLRAGRPVEVQVYAGLAETSSVLGNAVRTQPATEGRHWIENDRVRLLLGPEGAHVYRWEVKEAGNRDMTMPGETGWAGFGDLTPARHSGYELHCTASGPAMVEFRCTQDGGYEKTLRLYAGASWMEVFVDEATPQYWDFDNPKNFAADGPSPGTWLFSNGDTGAVGREADGVPAQVKAADTTWGMKYGTSGLALGLVTPGVRALHVVAPGAGAGGVGIEGSPAARHFVTFAGVLKSPPAETMNQVESTLDLKRPIRVRVYASQAR